MTEQLRQTGIDGGCFVAVDDFFFFFKKQRNGDIKKIIFTNLQQVSFFLLYCVNSKHIAQKFCPMIQPIQQTMKILTLTLQ